VCLRWERFRASALHPAPICAPCHADLSRGESVESIRAQWIVKDPPLFAQLEAAAARAELRAAGVLR
jgi:hypothetical protein